MTFQIINAQEERKAAQAAQAENSARVAYQTLTHRTTGVGQIILGDPLEFDTVFIEVPAVVSGIVLVRTPGPLWRYPTVTAGVYKWVTNSKGLFVGAYVYFNVECLPAHPDDPPYGMPVPSLAEGYERLAAEQAQLAQETAGTVGAMRTRRALLEAMADVRRAQRLADRKKPAPVIDHHLLFQGKAMKALPEGVSQELLNRFAI